MTKEIKETIGDRLRSVRISNNFSTNKFSEILGIAQSAITKIENGNSDPSAKTLLAIYEKFKIDPLWLLTGQTAHVIQNPNALKIGQLADNLPDEIQKIYLTLMKRELRLERMLKRETNIVDPDLPDNLDQ